jgi:hypothetical protein
LLRDLLVSIILSGIFWSLIFPPIIGKDMEVGTWPIDEIAKKKNRHNHKKRKTAAIADFSS